MSYNPFGIVMHCSISHGYDIIKDKQRNRCKNNQKLSRYDNDITTDHHLSQLKSVVKSMKMANLRFSHGYDVIKPKSAIPGVIQGVL